MNSVLCDDLIKDILLRLPHPSRHSACLVCKRWHSLLRSSSTTSLSLCVPFSLPSSVAATSLSAVLSRYPSLSNFTFHVIPRRHDPHPTDALLLAIAASPCARSLSNLCFFPDTYLSPSALLSSVISFPSLTSLTIPSLFPVSFCWLYSLPSLKSFSLIYSIHIWAIDESIWYEDYCANRFNDDDECANNSAGLVPLLLESLSFCFVPCNDRRLSWLWRRCPNLKKLRLRSCESSGYHPLPTPAFLSCLSSLHSLEIYTCGDVANDILLATDHCRSLTTLVICVYDRPDIVCQFIRRRGAGLHTLRLSFFCLNDDVLFAIAANNGCSTREVSGSQLKVLDLGYCNEITVKGLRSLALSPAVTTIEELSLVNCDALEREPGLLSLLVSSMQRLQKLDLSFNDKLSDKEIDSMLEKCSNLVDIRLRECKTLTSSSLLSLLKHRGQHLQVVDITNCSGIQSNAIEKLVLDTYKLRQLMIEEVKISAVAKGLLSQKGIQLLTSSTDSIIPVYDYCSSGFSLNQYHKSSWIDQEFIQ